VLAHAYSTSKPDTNAAAQPGADIEASKAGRQLDALQTLHTLHTLR
jgi:hypothetical protein